MKCIYPHICHSVLCAAIDDGDVGPHLEMRHGGQTPAGQAQCSVAAALSLRVVKHRAVKLDTVLQAEQLPAW